MNWSRWLRNALISVAYLLAMWLLLGTLAVVAVVVGGWMAWNRSDGDGEVSLEDRAEWDPSLRRGVRLCHLPDVEAAIVDEGAVFDGGTFELFGDGATLEEALACGPEMAALLARVPARNDGGDTALHAAVFLERPDLVAAVLDAGADVDVQDASGDTALLDAASAGSAPMVELLLTRGADPDLANQGGHLPLVRAVGYGHDDAAISLLAAGASPEAEVTVTAYEAWLAGGLADALLEPDPDASATMDRIEAAFGADPASDDPRLVLGPARPLFIAAVRGDAEVVRALLAAGADATVPGGLGGNRPVDAARIMGHDDVVALLGG